MDDRHFGTLRPGVNPSAATSTKKAGCGCAQRRLVAVVVVVAMLLLIGGK